MGVLCDIVTRTGGIAVADFVCPTPETRRAFAGDRPIILIWCARITQGRFEDTNKIFIPPTPEEVALRIDANGSVGYWANRVVEEVVNPSSHLPHALFLGRYQPFHKGHKKLIEEGIRKVGRVIIGIRNTHGADPQNNPFTLDDVEGMIHNAMKEYVEKYVVVRLPNVTDVMYGRDVGYNITKIDLDRETELISGTQIRSTLK
jgi:cytidyltransferase-like protein